MTTIKSSTPIVSIDEIEQTMQLRRAWYDSPRFANVVGTFVSTVLFWLAIYFALGWHSASFQLTSTVVALLIALFWRAPASYTALLDKQLLQYKPKNVGAFTRLQIQAKEFGGLPDEFLREWIHEERSSISSRPNVIHFWDKDVNDGR